MLNMRGRLLGPVLGLLIFGLTPSGARAQDITATITGFVRDSSGAAVAGATVVATNNATQEARSAKTNDAGEYTIALLPVGTYTLTVSSRASRSLSERT